MEKAYDHLQTESDWYRRWEEKGLFTPAPDATRHPFLDHPAAAQRDRFAAYRPRPHPVAARHHRAPEEDAGLQRAVAARRRPCRHRHADDGGKRPQEGDGPVQGGPGAGALPEAGLGLEERLGKKDRRPDQEAGPGAGLEPDEVHPERRDAAGRAPGLRRALQRGQDLPGHLHGEPLPQLQDGALRPGGRAQGGPRPPDLYPLPAAPGPASAWWWWPPPGRRPCSATWRWRSIPRTPATRS